MRTFGRVALGGTFDRLHVGHDALLGAAFASGRVVLVGLTTDAYLAQHPKPGAERIRAYAARRRNLSRYLRRRFPGRRWEISPISDRYGRAVGPGIDALVVSAETVPGARAVNAERRRRRLRSLPVVVVPLVLAEDLEPVSSRRIRAGAIGPWGERRSRMPLRLLADDPAVLPRLARRLEHLLPRAEVTTATARLPRHGGARARARALASRAAPPRGLGVAVARAAGAGAWVAVASRRVALPPRFLADPTPTALGASIRASLRPPRRKPIS